MVPHREYRAAQKTSVPVPLRSKSVHLAGHKNNSRMTTSIRTEQSSMLGQIVNIVCPSTQEKQRLKTSKSPTRKVQKLKHLLRSVKPLYNRPVRNLFKSGQFKVPKSRSPSRPRCRTPIKSLYQSPKKQVVRTPKQTVYESPSSRGRSAKKRRSSSKKKGRSCSASKSARDYNVSLKCPSSIPVFCSREEIAQEATRRYLHQVRRSAKEVSQLHLKKQATKKKPQVVTLDKLKESMKFSLQAMEKARASPPNFNSLVMGFSERITEMAQNLVDERVERERDAALLMQIAEGKWKRLQKQPSSTARSTRCSNSSRSSFKKSARQSQHSSRSARKLSRSAKPGKKSSRDLHVKQAHRQGGSNKKTKLQKKTRTPSSRRKSSNRSPRKSKVILQKNRTKKQVNPNIACHTRNSSFSRRGASSPKRRVSGTSKHVLGATSKATKCRAAVCSESRSSRRSSPQRSLSHSYKKVLKKILRRSPSVAKPHKNGSPYPRTGAQRSSDKSKHSRSPQKQSPIFRKASPFKTASSKQISLLLQQQHKSASLRPSSTLCQMKNKSLQRHVNILARTSLVTDSSSSTLSQLSSRVKPNYAHWQFACARRSLKPQLR